MSKYSDGKRTVEIMMQVWDGQQWGPRWEQDFFDNGSLPYDEEHDCYTVEDVSYLIEQANDWQQGIGDYQDDYEGEPGHRPEDRGVTVTELPVAIRIQFEGGQSRHGDYAVNILTEAPNQPGSDDREPLYAEVQLPDGDDVSDDYGYLVLKREILRQAESLGIAADHLEFWYDGQEDQLEADAGEGYAQN